MFCALSLALLSAGSSIAAKMAMMAMTTSNSISVNAVALRRLCVGIFPFSLARSDLTIKKYTLPKFSPAGVTPFHGGDTVAGRRLPEICLARDLFGLEVPISNKYSAHNADLCEPKDRACSPLFVPRFLRRPRGHRHFDSFGTFHDLRE